MPSRTTDDDRRATPWLLLICGLGAIVQIVATVAGPYGYFIDEFYYIACARRPALGYVDHPPLTPLLLAGWRHIAGDSLLAIRIPAFVAGALAIYATGRMTRELGGGRWAMLLAALTLAVAPVFLAVNGFYSVNAFELLFWTLCTWTLVRLLRTENPRLWLVFGVLAGLGLENKHTITSLFVALGIGLAATRSRRLLWNRWAVLGALVATTLALPNLGWQVAHGWPSLEFYREAQLHKNLQSPPVQTLIAQVLSMSPAAAPIWIAGLLFLLAARQGRTWRALGIAYLVLLAMLVISQQSRPDRLAGIYPALVAAGAVATERFVRRRLPRIVIMGLVVAVGAALSPVVIPLLPPARLAPYVAWIGMPTSAERGKTSPIPQLLADRTGWESFVDDVARAYESLPSADRRRVVIFVPSYGHAGALELLGPAHGIRARVISNHNNYYHWSEGVDADVLIAVGGRASEWRSIYADVKQVGLVQCVYCMSWRNDNPVFIARSPLVALSAVWPRLKHYE